MNEILVVSVTLAALMLAACGAATGPAGQASPAAVNPETGGRGSSPK